jgi:hypothetical protein
MMKRNLFNPLVVVACLLFVTAITPVRAALVGTGGYTNDFAIQPPAADWSTFSIGGGAGNILTAGDLDTAVQAVNSGSVTAQVQADPANPPPLLGPASWSQAGLYLQTRATGNGATLLMCTLVNNLGGNAAAATIRYDYARVAPVAEEVEGHRAYYSLSGTEGSWTPIPAFSSANPGPLSATINVAWPSGGNLYVAWADDNGGASPDTAYQIDNFSVTATPAAQTPAAITADPLSQTVDELQPVTLTVGLSGNPPPTVQWYTNNVPIPGATSPTLSIPSTPLSYSGLSFKAIAQNVASNVTHSATSAVAVLTVNADNVRPVLLGALASGSIQVVIYFSERLEAQSAVNPGNYSVTGPSGNLTVSNIVLDASQTNVVLTVTTMTPGNTYTLTVNGVRDQAAAANQIAANSQAQFTAATYTPTDIGGPAGAGSATVAGNGFAVTGGGTNIFGTSDQFFFNWRQIAGDFDLEVRLDGLAGSDLWAKAGLMARETLTPNSKHASTFATPSVSGTFFSYRPNNGTNTLNTGFFPTAYPNTWLRLKRVGAVFTGYAGVDGQTWVQLGTATLTTPANVFHVGMAVTGTAPSNAPSVTATAQFRELGDGSGGVVGNVSLPFEPPGPSSRNTGLIISEIMYHPKPSNNLEFIEIFNAGLIAENLGGFRISGDVDYIFPPNTILPVGSFLVVARNPADLQAASGFSGALGPWIGASTNALPDDEGTVRLRNRTGAMLLEVIYEGQAPWPLAADGTGHSLVLARPSYGEADPRAWVISDRIGGSPGRADAYGSDPLRNIVINEFLAHTDPPLEDFIELYNHSSQAVDISGAYLTDDRDTNKFRIPNGTSIPARGFVTFTISQAASGFALSSAGERIYFVNPSQTRVIDMVAFEAQANGVSSGRYPDGGMGYYELASRTPSAVNAPLLIHDVVINELMFNPISGSDDDEYVELYNRGSSAVDVSNWRFTSGIDYDFPANTFIAGNGYLVIGKNKANLLGKYPQLNNANTLGDYDGALANGGERIALARPDYFLVTNNSIVTTQANFIVVDETSYVDSGRWARWADGGGSSLELIDPYTDHRLPANWADSDETAKSQWTNIVHTGILDHNYPVDANGGAIDEIQVMLLGAGEALMDDLIVQMNNGTNRVVNPGFNSGLNDWLIQGNHVRSTLQPAGPGNPSQSMRIRATAGGDNGANRVECNVAPLTVNSNATIGGRFRWLRGFPIVLLRLHGGALEAVGTLPMPPDLGTPGLPNSRRLANAGPAIYDVTHAPVLPDANQPVLITARVSDPDGIASVQLRYRLDPSATVLTLALRDDGGGGDAVAGDGLYTVTLPGQAAGALVAFRLTATDALATPPGAANAQFPAVSAEEALIRFGEPAIFGNLGVYRIWMTASNLNIWTTRERLSNEAMDGTMAYGNFRAIYNSGARYRGSPFTRNPSSPAGVGVAANYVWTLPDDDLLLGSDELNLDCLEPGGSSNVRDVTALREVTAFEILNQLNLPFSYQRYVHIVINGITSTARNIPVYTDSQQPNGEYTRMWFPEGQEGDLYKIDDWFEFNDTPARLGNKSASLENFITTGGVKKQARYRWCWEKKFNRGLNDDYSSLFAAVDALNSPTPTYVQQLEREFELREWLSALAFRHVVGDWDGYGYQRGKNQFCYRPANGKFWMLMWDLDFALGCNSGHAPGQDLFTVSLGGAAGSDNMPEVNRMYTNGYTRRIYLQALQQMAEGPMLDASFLPPMDARYRALLANGVSAITSPYVPSGAQSLSIPAWLQQRRTFMLGNSGVGPFTNAPFRVTTPLNVTSSSNLITISGNASLRVKDILLNGVSWPVTWINVTSWTARVVLNAGNNSFRIEGIGLTGEIVTSNQTVVAQYTGPVVTPEGAVVFNEIMFNPLVPDAEYIELFNTSSNVTHDLAGWRLNGVDYTFGTGAFIAPRSHLVLFKNLAAFVTAHGSAIPVFDRFEGNLQANGETITLIKPGATPDDDVAIDKVRYEPVLPWPLGTNGIPTSASIQLIDPSEDNSRPLNWSTYYAPAVYGAATNFPGATNGGWRYATHSGLVAGGASPGTNFLIFLGVPGGEVYLDDMKLVVGTEPEAGPNLLLNGDFEEPLAPSWNAIGNHSNSVVSTSFSHSGNGSLRVIASGGGGPSSTVRQFIAPPPSNNTPHTLSYWFYSTTNSVTVTIRTVSGSLFVHSTNSQIQVIPPFSLPPQIIVPAIVSATPGSNNTSAASLEPIPTLWLNELQAGNTVGIVDNMGEREPWIELYNPGTTAVNLEPYYLANNYDTNLTQWPFPAGASIAPGEFKIIWADGEPGETAGNQLHTSFRLNASTGSVALVRVVNAIPEVLDYLTYSGVGSGLSYGDYPDGQPFSRFVMRDVTPGATNVTRFVNLYINEWLASNTTNSPSSIADPADGQFEDWFEIYNPGTEPVDLGGFYLTDSTSNNTNNFYRVPSNGQYVVPAGGFLLVWADNEPGQNHPDRPHLHANFALSRTGDRIILYGPDGRSLIDRVEFLGQLDDVSEGRFPDGTPNITALGQITPGGPNVLISGNTAPVIAAIGTKTAILGQPFSFTVTATDPQAGQTLTYSIVSGAPAGATLNPSSGLFTWNSAFSWTASTNSVTVSATDNGVPPLSDEETFTLIGLPPAPTLAINGNQVSISFQTIPGKTYRVEYKDDLNAATWQRLNNQDYAAGPATSLTVNDDMTGRAQRFYRFVQLD